MAQVVHTQQASSSQLVWCTERGLVSMLRRWLSAANAVVQCSPMARARSSKMLLRPPLVGMSRRCNVLAHIAQVGWAVLARGKEDLLGISLNVLGGTVQDVGAIRTLNGDLNTRRWRRQRPGHGWRGTKHTRIGETTSNTTEQKFTG